MINPWIILAVLLAILGAGAGGFRLGADHELASQARTEAQIKKVEEAVIAANATAIAQIRPKYTTIQGKLEKQIEQNTVYRDCKLDPVGLQLINEALLGGAQAPSSSKLPEANPPAK